MLAGYLPFDDDPANPEGDNINLLYRYIVSTPLTFPEWITPHARDLLRRILVPDPRKRADLFEVARHTWLGEYAYVVAHVTSSTTTAVDIANTTVVSGNVHLSRLFISSADMIPSRSPRSSRIGPQCIRSRTIKDTRCQYFPRGGSISSGEGRHRTGREQAVAPRWQAKNRPGRIRCPSIPDGSRRSLPARPPCCCRIGSWGSIAARKPGRW
jgi:serine/threonine protein kinase